ncbi:GNAT family N-acetyltransferase [Variovorax sp. J22R133]|uniref:GNAT family N-acetyltransferase n=1 Tax=Variovorax brevis TaxID=3053503 RepID=UPI00257546D6|nr:GNAT family N-acetyltransferase [Variovorax sp. J22R133]MDM0112248.1 GNAT family N-acetyltransferase [Variovorax sp. J22R133]
MNPFSQPAPALTESLFDDPFYQAISVDFEDDIEARKHALGLYFAYSLAEAQRTGRYVQHEDPRVGAAAWLLPRSPEVDAAESAAKAAYLKSVLGPRGNGNYHRIVEFMGPRAAQVVSDQAWYLSIVAVLPSAQGQGIGARLLSGTLAEAKSVGASCYLETFTPPNIPFYERMGFERLASHLEPTTRAEYVVMLRPGTA